MFVPPNYTSKLHLAYLIIQPPFKHAFKNQFHMWTSCTIKNKLTKEKYLEVDFRMSTIKPKLCGWLFFAWTQMCKRKEMICKGWALVEIMSFATVPCATMSPMTTNGCLCNYLSNLDGF
jgi:hypothetical protein